MRSRSIVIASAFAFAAGSQASFAQTASPTAAIEKLFLAFNADDGARVNESYAPDAVIVDEFAPYVWHGPAAGSSFWTSFLALRKAVKLTDIHVTHRPLAFLSYDEGKTTAYVVAPTTISCRLAGKRELETGQWVFVVVNVAGNWLIEKSSWATVSYSHG